MIEFNYKIERDEGDKIEVYVPKKIPKKIANITYIEGPNSSGKSTLLHILALAFHGLDNDSVHINLKRKMKNLMEANYQTLTFSIKITKGSKVLIIEKTNPKSKDIKFREKEGGKDKLLTTESLKKKYRLIYDIPENPTRRINSLLNEVKSLQFEIGNKTTDFRTYLLEIISEIRTSRDPKQIAKLEKDLKSIETSLKSTNNSYEDKTQLVDVLEKSMYYQYFREYTRITDSLNKQIEKKRNKLKYSSNKKLKKNEKYGQHIDWVRTKLKEAIPIQRQIELLIRKLLPDEKEHIKNWGNVDLSNVLKTFEFESNLQVETDYFKKVLNKKIEEVELKESYKSTKFFEDLLDVMNRYDAVDIKIPGIEKTLTEIKLALERNISENKIDLLIVDNAKKTLDLFDDLDKLLEHISTYDLPTLRNLKNKISDTTKLFEEQASEEDEIEELENELKDAEKKLSHYDKKYAQKNRPKENEIIHIGQGILKRFGVMTEEQLIDEIDSLHTELKSLKDEIKGTEARVERKKGELEIAKSKKQHVYAHQLEYLEKLLQIAMQSEKLMKNDFVNYLENIEQLKKPDTDEQKKYNDSVGKYIGDRVGEVRHGDKKYYVESIDLIDGIVYTKKGKKIRLIDMGTGQSQSAYLLGLLHSTDKREIVALFDEVAMMDNQSISPILKKLTEMHDSNNLLLGIMVQKAEKVKVMSQSGD